MKNLKSIFLLAIMFFACQTVLAQTDKGIEYYNNKDYANAVKCFQQAAEQGDAIAQNKLGNCYYNGEGVAQNFQEAVKWYLKAAEQGNAEAQNKLASCYIHGIGVDMNSGVASEWYQKAAENGNAEAQYRLACLNLKRGNEQEAMKLFRTAAENGNADAQYVLGDCYYNGWNGFNQDYPEAAKWFHEAAERGDPYAQYALGSCFYHGNGVPRNIKAGVMWFKEAFDQGINFDLRSSNVDYGIEYETYMKGFAKGNEKGFFVSLPQITLKPYRYGDTEERSLL